MSDEVDGRTLIAGLRGPKAAQVMDMGWDPASGGAYIKTIWVPDEDAAVQFDELLKRVRELEEAR